MHSSSVYLLCIIPPILFLLYAVRRTKLTFSKYSKILNQRGMTGVEIARALLDANGLRDVPVEMIDGYLNDHYDSRSRTMRLSRSVYMSRSVTALVIVAHETGHAIQHEIGYLPRQLQSAIAPVAYVSSNIGWFMVIVGVFVQFTSLAWVGASLFAAGTLFALLTLPVEYNASARAMDVLATIGIVDRAEEEQNRQVLDIVPLMYIAGFFAALMQLFYWLGVIFGITPRV